MTGWTHTITHAALYIRINLYQKLLLARVRRRSALFAYLYPLTPLANCQRPSEQATTAALDLDQSLTMSHIDGSWTSVFKLGRVIFN